MVKSGHLWWVCCTAGWRHLLLSSCGGPLIYHLHFHTFFHEYLQVQSKVKPFVHSKGIELREDTTREQAEIFYLVDVAAKLGFILEKYFMYYTFSGLNMKMIHYLNMCQLTYFSRTEI